MVNPQNAQPLAGQEERADVRQKRGILTGINSAFAFANEIKSDPPGTLQPRGFSDSALGETFQHGNANVDPAIEGRSVSRSVPNFTSDWDVTSALDTS